MLKRWTRFILILVLVLSFSTVFADVSQAPQVYNITVTEDGGKYSFNNVELTFKRGCLGKDMQPIDFIVSLYTENGVPYIDIKPSVENFSNDVTIKVHKGELEMYDIITGETKNIELKNFILKVEHFSRYIIQT